MVSFRAHLMVAFLKLSGRRLVYARPFTPEGLRNESPAPAKPGSAVRGKCHVEQASREGRDIYTISPLGQDICTTVLYFHGGAYIRPIMAQHWTFLADMAVRLKARIIIPLYPKVPEVDCTATVHFALAIYREVRAQVGEGSLFLMGDSAGGGLTLSVAMQTARQAIPPATGVILLSPWLDVSMSAPEQVKIAVSDPMLMLPGLMSAGQLYAGKRATNDPLPSPLYGSLAGLPPIQIISGSRDVLVTDSRRLAEKAKIERHQLIYHEAPGLMHVYTILPLPEADRARDLITHFVRTHSDGIARASS
ncbi:acetyl esterase/lipase [Neorhizobium galegae]|uniref:alpha/beta hydrolase fold domain-containing protein n=1 Tax=Neorhizobium galegae TaxID=399 RepID=UPI001AE8D4EA|nr:alpha/beta hydrolase [Neorhizobium galegae]MBP2549738.1 acetyl esterase/lipase [Neorhizobium galegae]